MATGSRIKAGDHRALYPSSVLPIQFPIWHLRSHFQIGVVMQVSQTVHVKTHYRRVEIQDQEEGLGMTGCLPAASRLRARLWSGYLMAYSIGYNCPCLLKAEWTYIPPGKSNMDGERKASSNTIKWQLESEMVLFYSWKKPTILILNRMILSTFFTSNFILSPIVTPSFSIAKKNCRRRR